MNLAESAAIETPPQPQRALRVLHVLDISLPLLTGYTIRSRGLITAERALGMDPHVISSPIHNIRDSDAQDTLIDGISYQRTDVRGVFARALRKNLPLAREIGVVQLLQHRLLKELRDRPYDVIHAHSPALCGLAALRAARRAYVPFVYEIRAFWEDAAVDQKRTTESSLRYKASRGMEDYVIRRADAVVGIASSILSDLERRGVPQRKLFHVPNGVNVELFAPLPRDEQLARQLDLGDVPVLGFIGSLYSFEGIPWLVRAAAELHRRGVDFKLLIAGHGEDAEAVHQAIAETGSQSYIQFLGKVPHDQVQRYYSLIDVMVYPRHSIRLTELVTPLKPLEAMAQKKAVLGSDVGGIRELVRDGYTGILFKADDPDDFCQKAARLLSDGNLRQQVTLAGYRFVHEEKDWKQIARRYEDVYAYAIAAAAQRSW